MPVHVITQGECLVSLAARYGIADPSEIHDHPRNAELRRKRPKPHMLAPGDEVFVPERERLAYDAETSRSHRFRANVGHTDLVLVLRDFHGQTLANKRYRLTVGARVFEGRSSGAGLIQHPIPRIAREGMLSVHLSDDEGALPVSWPVLIGHLDPIDEVSGVQGRLNNLGFDAGDPDGRLHDRTVDAIRAFQRKSGLDPTGVLDDRTRSAIERHHEGT